MRAFRKTHANPLASAEDGCFLSPNWMLSIQTDQRRKPSATGITESPRVITSNLRTPTPKTHDILKNSDDDAGPRRVLHRQRDRRRNASPGKMRGPRGVACDIE